MAYSDMKDSDKHRLAAAFINIQDRKSAMSKVDWDSASLDFQPNGGITGDSFRTSIANIKGVYAQINASHRNRLAASFANIKNPADLDRVMKNVDWGKATTDFKPPGKSMKSASFKTSIQRLLKDDSSGTAQRPRSGTRTTGKKRKAPAADRSSLANGTVGTSLGRKKKTKVNWAAEEDNASRSTSAKDQDTADEDLPQPSASSKASSPFPPIKTEDVDSAYDGRDELSEEEPQFFT